MRKEIGKGKGFVVKDMEDMIADAGGERDGQVNVGVTGGRSRMWNDIDMIE